MKTITRKRLANEAITIMTTTFNGTGLMRLYEICEALGLDIKEPVNRLAPKIQAIAKDGGLLKSIFMSLVCISLIGCASDKSLSGPQDNTVTAESLAKIQKQDSFITGAAGELSPIVFNGEVYFFSFGRETVSVANGFVKIQKYPSLETVSTFPLPYAYGSVLNDNGTIRIFASGESNPGNSIITITSTDMVNWTAPQVIFTAPANQTIYNTSPTKTDSGYALSYEIHEEGNKAWFYQRFLQSSDALTWYTLGTKYDRTNEEACPMLRYVDGYYYLFTTGDNGAKSGPRYTTRVTRSRDLINFEDSSKTVLASKLDGTEGNNNSDLDAIEFNGQLVIVYGVGDQVTWGAMKSAVYPGTLRDFVNEFY